jgi:hypothetical protein
LYQHLKDNTTAVAAAVGWDGDRYRIVRTAQGKGLVWVSVWDNAVDAARFVDALGQAIGKRYRTSAPTVASNGALTYSGSGRTVVITPREIAARNGVVFVDVPIGASSRLIDPAKISLGR